MEIQFSMRLIIKERFINIITHLLHYLKFESGDQP